MLHSCLLCGQGTLASPGASHYSWDPDFATIETMSVKESAYAPVIVAFVSDLMWSTKIESVARRLGYRLKLVETVANLGAGAVGEQPNLPGEPVFGLEAIVADKITEWQPLLLIFDLDSKEIPWRRWLAFLKSSPATRRIPILGYAPHEDVEVISTARGLGADAVVGRSRFSTAMADLIQENARAWDHESISKDCQAPLSDPALDGLRAFNQGEYFEAHELLEDAWNEDDGPARDVYKAVLQVAVAYLQIERSNYAGAIKMFLRARQWLGPLPDVCRGIDISQLRSNAQSAYEALTELGPAGVEKFDRTLFRPIRYGEGEP